MTALVLGIALTALFLYVLYVVIRRAVRDGIRDASEEVPTHSHGHFGKASTTHHEDLPPAS